jgi:peptide/nickel transport system substrate-binding protein
MLQIKRRTIVKAALAAPALLVSGRVAAQGDNRPIITIAVQQIVNANALDTLREQSNVGERVFASIFETLIGRNHQGRGEMIPALATEWRRLDDRRIELQLRQGVRFHSGEELTSEDVVFSFGPERMFGTEGAAQAQGALFTQTASSRGGGLPPEVPAVAKRMWPALDRIEAVDKYTVRFINKQSDVTLEGRIQRYGSEIISKRAFLEADNWLAFTRKPVGTGPYRVKEFKPDQSLVLEAFDEYWGGRPPIREVRFVVVPEISSRVNGLLSGQYDFACDLPPDQIPGVERNPRFEVVGGLIGNHRIIVFDKNHPQLADPRIRRAMTHAMDRQAIVDSLWVGRTKVPAGLQWEYYADMYHADWTVAQHDPARARQLVRDAGYKGDPIPFRVLNNYYTNQVATAQALTAMWNAVGLNVEIQMRENWQQIFDKSAPRAVRDWSNSAPFADPVSSIVNQHGPSGQQQQVGEWTNSEFNTLSGELESSTDRARRKAVFRRMLEIAEREDPAYSVIHQNATFTGKRKDVQWKPAPSFVIDLRSTNFRIVRG